MADGQTTNFKWTLPENHVNSNQWGGQNNANWQGADTVVYADQQAIAGLLGVATVPTPPATGPTVISNMQVASVPGVTPVNATVSFVNSTATSGQQLRWAWVENTTTEATGNVGSDFGLLSYTNAGAALRTNIFINRSTGAISFAGAATFSSTLTCTATFACKNAVSVTAASASDNAVAMFYNSAGTRQGYCGWLVSGDQIQLAADGGPSIILSGTNAIALNGNVTGSGTASFTSLTTSGAITAGTNVTATNQVSAKGLAATQGAVTITGGSLNPNPAVTMVTGGISRANFYYNPTTDQAIMNHQVSGGALVVDNVANFTFNGNNAYKPGGGSWAATSDARIKNVKGDYEPGLNEVLQLRPIVYSYKGNDALPGETSLHDPKKEFVGLVAQEVETIFPDMVNQRAGYIDGQAVSDLRDVDASELIYALVNAVRQLKAEIETLKAK